MNFFSLFSQSDQETLRSRIQEVSESVNGIELELSELRADTTEQLERIGYDADGREKILVAKVEDLNDRLRLGMNKLQACQFF